MNGFLCKAKDPADLADKMEEMMSMTQQKRMEMGAASRRYIAERFDEKLVIAAYLDAVDRLAGTVHA